MTQALVSISMEEILNFFLAEGAAFAFACIVALLYCRRNPPEGGKGREKERGVGGKAKQKDKTSLGYCCSNESTDVDSDAAVTSTSGSEKEAISSKHKTSAQKKIGGTGFNVETEPVVPKAVSKKRHIAERLHEIVASSEGDIPSSLDELIKRRLNRPQNGSPTDLLQQVLGKLTIEDAAIVKEACLQAPRRATDSEDNTLKSNLKKLGNVDSNRVFMVRKLTKLGLNSPELLKEYFSAFGVIENVYVTHATVRNARLRSVVGPEDVLSQPTVTPAGVGFIVMEKAEDVVNIFKHGLEHTISGVAVAVTAYVHHDPENVIRNESKFGLSASSEWPSRPRCGRFPTYANITEDNTMRANLQKLAEFDANRIFMVRRINKLGLGSAPLLKTHFGQFGSVTNVFVTHSVDRRKIDPEDPSVRPPVRAAGIGFVVMDKPEDVDAIFQNGLEHEVYGVKINVAPYEHQLTDAGTLPDKKIETPVQEEVETPAKANPKGRNAENYKGLIFACSRKGDAVGAENLALEMESKGFELKRTTYTTVIDACAKAGDVDRAELWMTRLLNSDIQPNVVSYCAMIDACAKAGNAKKARKWHKELQASGIEPNKHSFSAVINACSKCGDLSAACRMLEQMGKVGVEADIVIFTNVLDACARVKNGALAREVFDHMLSCKIYPNIMAYTSLARGFAHSGDWKEVEQIAEEMTTHRVAMNEYFLYILLLAYSQARPHKQADRAEAAFLKYRNSGFEMNHHIFGALERAVGTSRYQNLMRAMR